MANKPTVKKGCIGSPTFDSSLQAKDDSARDVALEHLQKDELQDAIISWFKLPAKDTYVYHAMTSVQLAKVQEVVKLGGRNGLHSWYRDEQSEPLSSPPQSDIESYINIFQSSTNTAASLKGFAANAKKTSIRLSIANNLIAKRYLHSSHTLSPQFNITKSKKPPNNSYFDFWAWSCRNLEWCGPCAESERSNQSHHVLPIFMHHFGCAVPSHEALELLRLIAAGRTVADIGSGNGYWTFMLRAYGVAAIPIDNAQSEWRVTWVDDTVVVDGVRWLGRKENAGGRDMVLLLVYPIVGGGVAGGEEGGFTRSLMQAYRGDTVAVVGTQNHNGYTGFKEMTMGEYMQREHPNWVKIIQVPLPSFAGKDEALFVFQRGERAPPAMS